MGCMPRRWRNGSRPRVRNEPLHVNVHLMDGLPELRNPREYACICQALRAAQERFGCRVVAKSVLSNHVHLVVEAPDEEKLSQFMKGLMVRIARGLNKLWQRKGPVFRERFHAVVLKTVKQIRNAVRYVLQNARNHGIRLAPDSPDPYSSGPWYRFWRERMNQPFRIDDCPVAEPRTPLILRACTVVPIGLNELPARNDGW